MYSEIKKLHKTQHFQPIYFHLHKTNKTTPIIELFQFTVTVTRKNRYLLFSFRNL